MKKIIFTGGGSSGHVTPNVAVINKMLKEGWQVAYIGSKKGIEREIIGKLAIPYFTVSSGKLRRYFSWQNFLDPCKILTGICQAYFIIRKQKPDVVFSKGGFVAFPVVVAAWLNRIPILAHESDITPGLANRLSFPFVKKICVTYAETKKNLKEKSKVIHTGTPIREAFTTANKIKGLEFCGFDESKKMLLIIGGGQGALRINNVIHELLPQLLENFNIAHICGVGKTDPKFDNVQGYKQFEYLHDELFDVFKAADIIISRAGANSVYELLANKKIHILIPLPLSASRGDQILNAKYFAKQGFSQVIMEEELNATTLLEKLRDILANQEKYQEKMQQCSCENGTEKVFAAIREQVELIKDKSATCC